MSGLRGQLVVHQLRFGDLYDDHRRLVFRVDVDDGDIACTLTVCWTLVGVIHHGVARSIHFGVDDDRVRGFLVPGRWNLEGRAVVPLYASDSQPVGLARNVAVRLWQ